MPQMLHSSLTKPECREELFEEMMGERDDVAAKRTACQAAIGALREALGAVDSVPTALLSRINSPHRRAHQPRGLVRKPHDCKATRQQGGPVALQCAVVGGLCCSALQLSSCFEGAASGGSALAAPLDPACTVPRLCSPRAWWESGHIAACLWQVQ